MSWVAVAVGVGGAVVGAVGSNRAAGKAADAQGAANQAAIDEQRRQYDQTRQDQLPFLNSAYTALGIQNAMLGGDFSQFYNSPDYAYTLDESMKALDRGAAARGAMFSGGADADRIRLGQGLASQNFNNFWDRLRGMTGQGQGAAQSLGSLGANSANGIAGLLSSSGQARASSYLQQGNNWAQLAGGIGNAIGYGLSSRPPQQQPQPYGGARWTYTGPTASTYGYTG